MKLEDFTEQEQEQIKKGLTFSVISDKETEERILSLVPEELMKKIPFFVRKHANTRTVKRISIEYPELYAAAQKRENGQKKKKKNYVKLLQPFSKKKWINTKLNNIKFKNYGYYYIPESKRKVEYLAFWFWYFNIVSYLK